MNKTELIEALYKECGNDVASKAAMGRIVDATIATVTATVKKGEEVSIAGFGSVKVVKRAARKGVNPQTGEKIKIKATNAVKFKAGKALKEAAAKAKI